MIIPSKILFSIIFIMDNFTQRLLKKRGFSECNFYMLNLERENKE